MKLVYTQNENGVNISYSCSKCGLVFGTYFMPNGVFLEEPDISTIVPFKCPCGERQLMSMRGECEIELTPRRDDPWLPHQRMVSFVRHIPISVEVSFVGTPTAQEVDLNEEI